MPINDPKEVFVSMLSDVRRGAERSTKVFEALADAAQDPDTKELLKARVTISNNILSSLDECFRLIGKQPNPAGKLHEMMIEDFKKELSEIQSPEARRLFVLAKAIHLLHWRIGEYVALTAAADMTGHQAVGALLETCLADKLAFVERARRMIRQRIRERVAA